MGHHPGHIATNINNAFFDVGAASAASRTPDLPLYTFRNRVTGETRQLTDAGRGNVTGLWSDLGRFKTPTLRALAALRRTFTMGSLKRWRRWSGTTRLAWGSCSQMRNGRT